MIKDLKYAHIPLCDSRIMAHCLSLISVFFFLIWIVSENDNYCIEAALSTSFFNDIIHSQKGRGEAVIIKLRTQCCYFLLSPGGSWSTTGCLEHVKRKTIQTSGNEWEIMQLFWSKILSIASVLCRSS